MRRFSRSAHALFWCCLVFIGMCALSPRQARAQPHPRLLLTQENLQRAITNIQPRQRLQPIKCTEATRPASPRSS
jgi:hypothetical protein